MDFSKEDAQGFFLQGVAEFNQQRYFDCHESFEHLWNHLSDPCERDYVQGLLQIAVALHHARKKNSIGHKNLMEKGLVRLLPLEKTNWTPQHGHYDLPQIDLPHFLRDIDDFNHHRLDGWMPMMLIIP